MGDEDLSGLVLTLIEFDKGGNSVGRSWTIDDPTLAEYLRWSRRPARSWRRSTMPNLAVNLPMKAFKLIDAGCPACGATKGGRRGVQYHSVSVWCLRCGWAANWNAILRRIDDDGRLTGDVHRGLADG